MFSQAAQHAAALKEAQQLLAWLSEQQAVDSFAQEEATAAAADQTRQLAQQDIEIAGLHEQLVGPQAAPAVISCLVIAALHARGSCMAGGACLALRQHMRCCSDE